MDIILSIVKLVGSISFIKSVIKKKAYIRHIYLDSGTANHLEHMLEEYNINNNLKKKAKLRRLVFKQLYF